MTENNLYCGIDVSTTSNVAALIDNAGAIVDKTRSFPQNQSGARDLKQWLSSHAHTLKVEKLLIATEATSFYDLPIIDYLAESAELASFHPECYRLNAKYVKRFRQSMGEREKTDWVDARVIAERLRSGSLPHPYHSSTTTLPLQRLTRYRVHLVGTISREKQHLLAHLFLKYSNYKAENPLKGQTLGATSRAVLTEFMNPEELAEAPLGELIAFVAKHGKNRSKRKEEIARGLKAMARESHRIRPTLAKTVNVIDPPPFS